MAASTASNNRITFGDAAIAASAQGILTFELSQSLSQMLSLFSKSNLYDKHWHLDIGTACKSVHVEFPPLSVLDDQILRTAVIESLSTRASASDVTRLVSDARPFFDFLAQKHTTILSIRSSLFNLYVSSLDKDTSLSSTVKNNLLNAASRLIITCQQHNWLTASSGCLDISYRFRDPQQPKRAPDQCVIESLDVLFFDLSYDIPLPIRCVYLLLRLIANRIGEILAMDCDCISYPQDEVFAVAIPTYKETQYHTLQYAKYNLFLPGFCENILFLCLREQQERVKDIQPDSEKVKNYLFLKGIGNLLSEYEFNNYLVQLIDKHRILTADGLPATVTSHDLRHIDVVERLASSEFSEQEVRDECNHHSLLQTYAYGYASEHDEAVRVKEFSSAIAQSQFGMTQSEECTEPKVFSLIRYNRLLSAPQTRELPGYGICADQACTPRFELCFHCDDFRPNPYYLPYFDAAKRRLENKLEDLRKHHGNPQTILFNQKQLALTCKFIDRIHETEQEHEELKIG